MPPNAERRLAGERGGAQDGHGGNVHVIVTSPAVERLREALEEHGCQPRGSHVRFRARCPVHGSRGGTLIISQGGDRALIYCHAQCETTDILAALGLSWADLYDEPRDIPRPQWRRTSSSPASSPAEQAARVIVRAAAIMLTAEAQQAAAFMRPRLTAAERVELAEWACRRDADAHYWRTLAHWAALACDETYVRQAYKAARAWLDKIGDRPTHEQFMVLLTRAEDLERAR